MRSPAGGGSCADCGGGSQWTEVSCRIGVHQEAGSQGQTDAQMQHCAGGSTSRRTESSERKVKVEQGGGEQRLNTCKGVWPKSQFVFL